MTDFKSREDIKRYILDVLRDSFAQADRANNMFRTNLQEYIEKILDNSFNNISEEADVFDSMNNNVEVFEIHDYLFIRRKIPDGIDEKSIQIFVKDNRVKIQWEQNDSDIVDLPVNINIEEGKAIVKDNVLELRFPKVQGKVKKIDVKYNP